MARLYSITTSILFFGIELRLPDLQNVANVAEVREILERDINGAKKINDVFYRIHKTLRWKMEVIQIDRLASYREDDNCYGRNDPDLRGE